MIYILICLLKEVGLNETCDSCQTILRPLAALSFPSLSHLFPRLNVPVPSIYSHFPSSSYPCFLSLCMCQFLWTFLKGSTTGPSIWGRSDQCRIKWKCICKNYSRKILFSITSGLKCRYLFFINYMPFCFYSIFFTLLCAIQNLQMRAD